MKKTNKLFIALLSLGVVGSTALLSGCDKKNESVIVNDAKCSISLSKSSLTMCVGDSTLLNATISGGTSDTKIVYKSTNESIATVTENGLVNALKPGRAEIKAIYGTSISKCVIDVSLMDNVPVINITNIKEKSIKVDSATRVSIDAVINFNNADYNFVPSYVLSNDVGYMDGSTFVPVKNGVTYVTVTGSFFGTTAVSSTLEITVEDNVVIYMKGEDGLEANSVRLYSHPGFGEETFKTTFTASFGVSINNVNVKNPSLSIKLENDDKVVKYDVITGKLTSTTKPGYAKFVVTYNAGNAGTHVKTFDIYNDKTVFNYNAPFIEVDTYEATLPLTSIFSEFSSKTIVRATSLDGKTDYEIVDQKIVGLPLLKNEENELITNKIVIYNDTVGYIVEVKTFTKIIDEASDLTYFTMHNTTEKFDGYFMLANDINGSGYVVPEHARTMGKGYGDYSNAGFVGSFDGRGHTIKNISVGEGGLFGNIGKGAKIKNVAFKDFTIRKEAGKDDTAMLSSYVNGATFENVYLYNSYILGGYNAGLLCTNLMNNCSLNSCLFECPQSNTSEIVSKNYGIFGSMFGEKSSLPKGSELTYTNVVIKSPLPLVKSDTNSNDKEKFFVDTEDFVISEEEFKNYYLGGDITHYVDDNEMRNSSNEFNAFNDDYWSVNNGILAWKNN